MCDSSHALLATIDDILDLSKMEAGHFDLGELLESSTRLLATRLEGRPVTMQSTLAPGLAGTYHADAGRLRQVLLNLLGNAVKFTERGAAANLGLDALASGLLRLEAALATGDKDATASAHQQMCGAALEAARACAAGMSTTPERASEHRALENAC